MTFAVFAQYRCSAEVLDKVPAAADSVWPPMLVPWQSRNTFIKVLTQNEDRKDSKRSGHAAVRQDNISPEAIGLLLLHRLVQRQYRHPCSRWQAGIRAPLPPVEQHVFLNSVISQDSWLWIPEK